MAFYSGKIVKTQEKKKSPFLWIFLLVVLLGIGGGIFAFSLPPVQQKLSLYRCYIDSSLSTKQYGSQNQVLGVTIPTGSDTLTIGKLLQEKGAIASSYDFMCYVNKINAAEKIQAGYYELTTPISIEQVVPSLQNAKIPTVRVTLQEGLRVDEIATILDTTLAKNNTIKQFNKEEFLKLITNKDTINTVSLAKGKNTLEGFVFPDTYEFAKNATTTDILQTLLNTYKTKVVDGTSISQFQADVLPYDVMVLASIIEKEAGKSVEEKQIVAGILLKRLKAGWFLGVDATYLYVKKDWHATITAADIASNSPYNTRNHKGLPPTPISNPGLVSIQAVLTPKNSPYWYYLHDTQGVIHYAKNQAEHDQNIALYLR